MPRRSSTHSMIDMSTHANTAQILSAFQKLTDDELLALRKYAQTLIGNTSFTEPLDLIHEALARALDGRRNWPMHVNFGLFMALSMRSIVDAERSRQENQRGRRVSIDDLLDSSPDLASAQPSVEEELIAMEQFHLASQAAAKARVALAEDQDALRVLNGMLGGLSPQEMCSTYSMSPKTFDAARHRVMRRLRPSQNLH